jgi:small-conductance mechanosensitive channel
MSTAGVISLVLALAIPVLVGLAFSRLFLPKLAKRLARAQGHTANVTVFQMVRLPVVALSWLAALYLASHVLRADDVKAPRWVNWDALELWIRVASTLIIFYIVYRSLLYGLRLATARTDASSSVLLQKILSAFFFAIAVVTALNQFSIDIGPVLASLGVAALAVALALQDTLSNYFAGITLALDRPIRPGDYIRIEGGLEGFVQSIGWRTTHIKPFAETVVVVPNSKLANSILTNTYYPDESIRVYIDGGVSYESDLEEVEELLLDLGRRVLRTTEGADADFEPLCFFKEFGDSNIGFQVILRAKQYASSSRIKHAFIKAVHAAFRERGIEINYPVRKLIADPSLRQAVMGDRPQE